MGHFGMAVDEATFISDYTALRETRCSTNSHRLSDFGRMSRRCEFDFLL